MSATQATSSGHRARVLRALGVTPWVRRSMPAMGAAIVEDACTPYAAGEVPCVVVLPQGCGTRELDLVGRALNACGAAFARAARLTVRDGQLAADIPPARAYLVFGEAQAHALGRQLSAATLHSAQIVLADEPAQVLVEAAAKRRLWTALRNVRRALGGNSQVR